ncbi:MAG: ADP-ribose pyrophosphatase [Candidatus Omnitrophica bacterium CG11_big_fil_rev_8_21_14_0_20_64_10]|nr:MAG: ADP-ribose pyrophosphatase [Candidatus Omnitrophica bacterium CG11_big_fil_rev_8_21_14_0_20_64_10]
MGSHPVKKISSRVLYRGGAATLRINTYQAPSGHRYRREVIQHPMSVVILPLLPGRRLLLIRQYRHAIGRTIYELPAGTSEPGEAPLPCAKRELAEETGHRAGRWERLCDFYPAPGISTERMVLYRAARVTPLARKVAMDADEIITTEAVTEKEALRMIRSNQILDAKTIVGLLVGLKRVRWS